MAYTGISKSAGKRITDCVRAWESRQLGGNHSAPSAVPQLLPMIPVWNDSGEDQAAFAVLGIDDSLPFPPDGADADKQKLFEEQDGIFGVTPTVADHLGKWVVLSEPIDAGERGLAWIYGAVKVRVYVNSVAAKFCDVIEKVTVGEGEEAEDCYLGTGSSGAQVLWMEAGAVVETIVWAIVRLGGSTQSSKDFYVLLDDIYGDTYSAYAYKGEWNSSTKKRYVPTEESGDRVRVVVVDSTQVLGAFASDWVVGQDTGETVEDVTYGTLPIIEITSRLSSQTTFPGELLGALLAGASTTADLIINGVLRSGVAVYDEVMSEGDSVAAGTKIIATYQSYDRTFYAVAASCPLSTGY